MEPTKKWGRWPARGSRYTAASPQTTDLDLDELGEDGHSLELLGGGWYALPNGARVRGLDAAKAALANLEGF